MKVVVTGAKGLLGAYVVRELQGDGFDVTAADRSAADVTSLGDVRSLFARTSPDAVIHCAAWTDVDGCEGDPDRAFRVNALGTRNVAQGADERGAHLVYLSTEQVFDGTSGRPYGEFDRPNPLSVYGASKAQGEWYATHLCQRVTVVRSSWLFGGGAASPASAVVEQARRLGEVAAVEDQVGCPTYVGHLASLVRRVVAGEVLGIIHAAGGGRCTGVEFARRILELRGLGDTPVTAVRAAELGRAAPRPAFAVLGQRQLRLEGLDPLPHWHAGLAAWLAE